MNRVEDILGEERERFARTHPRSRELHEQARRSLVSGVPMTWMATWAGGHPIYAASARGATIEDVDGNAYVDLCLGDTGAMAGHSPRPTVDAVRARLEDRGGATLMLPTEDAAWVGDELTRRFGLPLWSFSLTATDANRWALRLCRALTDRPKVLVFNFCYHGSVDETLVTLVDARPRSRSGNVGPAVDPTTTTEVCEFNDLGAVAELLSREDVACVLTEPALTNIGIVLPQPGFLEGLREVCDDTGTLLIVDETHTLSAGPGGCTQAWGLRPDVVTLGKALGAGIPIGAYGVTAEVGRRIEALDEGVAWSIVQLGARAELAFAPEPPPNGGASARLHDDALEDALHLFMLNRGVLITPFHTMTLTCPATTEADVDRHDEVFAEAVDALAG
jgi:glutamate-1-semialdehyde 2,1-aminomutase